MKYEDRVVLFLDILGFRNHLDKTIDKSGKDNELEIQKLYTALQSLNSFKSTIKRDVTQFSDSLVISFKADSENEFLNLLEGIAGQIIYFVQSGIICRGAISYGKLIHTKEIVFGPALVDAYITESKAAIYPRVIIDSELFEKIKIHTNFYTDGREQEGVLLSFLSKDEDDNYFIDYFEKSHCQMDLKEINEYTEILRAIITLGLKSTKPDLKAKYGWMKNKFNKMVNEFTADKFISYFGKDKDDFEIVKLRNLMQI